jgi:DMSO/TMAO reductase YedYZ molybdopterin-dependent catalytic subunit
MDVFAIPGKTRIATLDCTLGWYTVQPWRGVPLSDLMQQVEVRPGAFGVRLASNTGYSHIFTMSEAEEILLASHIGDEPLDHWHGFPLRAVVPSRRGWFWVKWLTEVQVLG